MHHIWVKDLKGVLQLNRLGQSNFQIGVGRDGEPKNIVHLEIRRCDIGCAAALRFNQQNLMAQSNQATDETLVCHRDAIDLGRVGFGDQGNSHTGGRPEQRSLQVGAQTYDGTLASHSFESWPFDTIQRLFGGPLEDPSFFELLISNGLKLGAESWNPYDKSSILVHSSRLFRDRNFQDADFTKELGLRCKTLVG